MASERSLFSESWHRVAAQHIRLRPSVTVHKQYFRGETWFIAHDAYGDQYFRFRPEAWDFISRLDGRESVEDIWQSCLDRNGDGAPGQAEVVQMLAQLYNSNLILSDVPADVSQLFKRLKKRKANEWKARLFGIFFLRIPLWDPDQFLNRSIGLFKPVLGKFGAGLWCAVTLAAVILVLGNWQTASDQSSGIFDPSNWLLLYAAFAVTKLIHEMGHAYAVKYFGGEVHRMGITFLVFTPFPFVDATAAWAFRERWKRISVGAAGMGVELFFAALAAFVWGITGPGLINALAYNVMIVASVSTLLFNLNPLLRFDGYYIVADLTDTPNLHARSSRQWFYWIERYVFGGKLARSPADSSGEATWLGLFGISALVYRFFITFTIILFVADKFFGLGFLAALLTVIGFVVMPLYKGARFVLSEPRIEPVRSRAIGVTASVLLLLFVLLAVVPFPQHFRAPGVIKAGQSHYVIAGASGLVEGKAFSTNTMVDTGEVLFEMRNPELMLQIADLEAELAEVQAMERRSFSEAPERLAALAERRAVTETKLAELHERAAALQVKAPTSGRLILVGTHAMDQRWINRGDLVGEIVGQAAWEFRAVVSQDDAGKLFSDDATAFEIRFPGSAGQAFTPEAVRLIPGRQDFLPSPALGWPAGGPVRLSADASSGLKVYEPYFMVIGTFSGASEGLWHGRTGVARFEASPRPLLQQWIEQLRQLLQRRFQI
jgi:putative peptide zinc metalloprotease protein